MSWETTRAFFILCSSQPDEVNDSAVVFKVVELKLLRYSLVMLGSI